MPIAQIAALVYIGMMIESPAKRQQFMKLINGAGAEVEKMMKDFTRKGAVNDVPDTADETEFK